MKKNSLRQFFTIPAILVFAIVAVFGFFMSCSFNKSEGSDESEEEPYIAKENEILVTISGLADKSISLKSSKAAALWAGVTVIDGAGNQTGQSLLTLTDGTWKGYVQVSDPGAMTFIAAAGTSATEVSWIGNAALTVGGTGQSLSIAVTTPALGAKGPAGGSIFYDKGSYSNGWRYLEASPSDTAATASGSDNGYRLWAADKTIVVANTDKAIGYGKENTDWILATGNETMFPAAWHCANLEYNGASDWFLPSYEELKKMREVLGHSAFHVQYKGSFWSSTERTSSDGGTDAAYYICTYSYKASDYGPAIKTNTDLYVKAARRF